MGIGSATNDRATRLKSVHSYGAHFFSSSSSSIHCLFTCTQEFNNLAAILIFTWSCTKSLPFFLYSNEHLNYCFRFSFGRVAWHGIVWLFLCFCFFFCVNYSTLQFNSFPWNEAEEGKKKAYASRISLFWLDPTDERYVWIVSFCVKQFHFSNFISFIYLKWNKYTHTHTHKTKDEEEYRLLVCLWSVKRTSHIPIWHLGIDFVKRGIFIGNQETVYIFDYGNERPTGSLFYSTS